MAARAALAAGRPTDRDFSPCGAAGTPLCPTRQTTNPPRESRSSPAPASRGFSRSSGGSLDPRKARLLGEAKPAGPGGRARSQRINRRRWTRALLAGRVAVRLGGLRGEHSLIGVRAAAARRGWAPRFDRVSGCARRDAQRRAWRGHASGVLAAAESGMPSPGHASGCRSGPTEAARPMPPSTARELGGGRPLRQVRWARGDAWSLLRWTERLGGPTVIDVPVSPGPATDPELVAGASGGVWREVQRELTHGADGTPRAATSACAARGGQVLRPVAFRSRCPPRLASATHVAGGDRVRRYAQGGHPETFGAGPPAGLTRRRLRDACTAVVVTDGVAKRFVVGPVDVAGGASPAWARFALRSALTGRSHAGHPGQPSASRGPTCFRQAPPRDRQARARRRSRTAETVVLVPPARLQGTPVGAASGPGRAGRSS